jgi:hypothetical protein
MTQMATKVKLADLPKNPDGSPTAITIVVTECVEVEGNFGPQARITGANIAGDVEVVFYEKLDAVTRQLGRIGMGITDAVGRTLSFWKEQAQNAAGQTFPALRIAAVVHDTPIPATAFKPAAPKATAKQPISDGGPLPWEKEEAGAPPKAAATANVLVAITGEYLECLKQAQTIALGQRLDALNGDLVGAVTAIAATLFSEKNRRSR